MTKVCVDFSGALFHERKKNHKFRILRQCFFINIDTVFPLKIGFGILFKSLEII